MAVLGLLFFVFIGIRIARPISKNHGRQASSRESLNSQLLKVAQQGETRQIRALLDEGADQKDQALLLAAQQGKSEAIKLLLDRGAHIEARDMNGDTAVILAAGYPKTDALEVLLDRGADGYAKDSNRETALMAAARGGNADCIALLLAHVTFTPEERKDALFVAAESEPLVVELPASELPHRPGQGQMKRSAPPFSPPDYPGAVRRLLEGGKMNVDVRDDGDQDTPLIRAAAFGQTRTVKMLLEMGASASARDQNGNTPLLAAACECAVIDMPDTLESMQLLLDHGADIEAKDKDGDTPLMHAASWGRTENVKLLLDRGAKIDARNSDGETALAIAAAADVSLTQDTVILFVRRGANVNAANRKGDTPLMVAAASPGYGDKTEMMQVLLASGADPRVSDREGHTALSLAKQGGSVNVVNLLENALAKYR